MIRPLVMLLSACNGHEAPPEPPVCNNDLDRELAQLASASCDVQVAGTPGRAMCTTDPCRRRTGKELSFEGGSLLVSNAGTTTDLGFLHVLDVASDGTLTARAVVADQVTDDGMGRSSTLASQDGPLFVSALGPQEHGLVYRFDAVQERSYASDALWTLTTTADGLGRELIVGDFNADHSRALAVSLENSNANVPDPGRIYIVPLDLSGETEVESVATARLNSPRQLDGAGYPADGGGDVDADGFEDLVIGAYLDDPDGAGRGAAYIATGPFVGDINLADEHGIWIGEAAGDYAGDRVDLGADLNGDGYDDVLITSEMAANGGVRAGRAYVVHGPGGGTHSLADADAFFDGGEFDGLGRGLAFVGDFSGDGSPDFAMGAPGDQSGAPRAGRVFVFDGSLTGELSASDGVVIESPTLDDRFGFNIDPVGDLDGDGFADLAIGAYASSLGGEGSGAIYVVFGQAP